MENMKYEKMYIVLKNTIYSNMSKFRGFTGCEFINIYTNKNDCVNCLKDEYTKNINSGFIAVSIRDNLFEDYYSDSTLLAMKMRIPKLFDIGFLYFIKIKLFEIPENLSMYYDVNTLDKFNPYTYPKDFCDIISEIESFTNVQV